MHVIWNNAKTVLLMSGMMALALAIGYWVGGPGAMVIAFLIGGGINIFTYFYSDKLALRAMRAQEVTRDDAPSLWEVVRMLSERADMPMPRVYISPAAAPNAFATGRNPKHSAVCVTAGLLDLLCEEELAGVIAHELAHVKHRDILISTVASIIAGGIFMLSRFAIFFGGGDDDDGSPLVGLLIMILAPIAAMLIQMAVSRSREYEADRFGAKLVGSPRGLARSLEKLARGASRIPLAVPDTQKNMFIVAPFSGRQAMNLFSTHPPVEKRVQRLMSMES